jgi:hypothetical protein
MPSCALCENVQPGGDACEVCGHPFPARERVDVLVEPLPDMEATLLPGTDGAGEVPALEGFENTSIGPVTIVATAMEGLETTAAEGIPGQEPADEPPAVVCRYCRTAGFPGEAFCAHCGMRMPALAGAQAAALAAVLCRDCGTPVRGESCPVCGVRPSR